MTSWSILTGDRRLADAQHARGGRMAPNRDSLLRPSASAPVETTTITEQRHQPGDDLDHICATHSEMDDGTILCRVGIGCRSYCGIDLTVGGWYWDGDDPDVEVQGYDCVVCESMWRGSL